MGTTVLLPDAGGRVDARARDLDRWTRYRDLVVANAFRSLKVRYRGSFLGIYWSLSNPLMMTLVYTAIFGAAFSSYYGSILNYVLACFAGLAFLNFFSGSTSMALPSIVGNGGLLNKLALPPSIFPVATIAAATFQLFVGVLPLLAIVTLVISHNPLNVIALLVPALAVVLFSLGFALAVSALYVYFRDLSYLYELIVFVLWITSPIFYPAALVPAAVRSYLRYNPLASIIECVRQIALSGARPSVHLMAAALVASIVVLALGTLTYASLRRGFMDLI
jgi:ABC-type polysaccharide/polyol phosphate export permease